MEGRPGGPAPVAGSSLPPCTPPGRETGSRTCSCHCGPGCWPAPSWSLASWSRPRAVLAPAFQWRPGTSGPGTERKGKRPWGGKGHGKPGCPQVLPQPRQHQSPDPASPATCLLPRLYAGSSPAHQVSVPIPAAPQHPGQRLRNGTSCFYRLTGAPGPQIMLSGIRPGPLPTQEDGPLSPPWPRLHGARALPALCPPAQSIGNGPAEAWRLWAGGRGPGRSKSWSQQLGGQGQEKQRPLGLTVLGLLTAAGCPSSASSFHVTWLRTRTWGGTRVQSRRRCSRGLRPTGRLPPFRRSSRLPGTDCWGSKPPT